MATENRLLLPSLVRNRRRIHIGPQALACCRSDREQGADRRVAKGAHAMACFCCERPMTCVQDAISWASTHGLVMASDAKKSTFIHCPVTLMPSEVCHRPRFALRLTRPPASLLVQLSASAYEHAKDLATDFNLLVDRVRCARC